MIKATAKERLLESGLEIIHERGYHATGIQDILVQAKAPRGSFYHYFSSKEAFCLAIINVYAERGYTRLDTHLYDRRYTPLTRLRRFFEETRELYAQGGCRRGCLLGNLGQELADVSEACRQRVNQHLQRWSSRLADGLREAQARDELAGDFLADEFAAVLLNSWEGALLRMKLTRDIGPLNAFIRLYFDTLLRRVTN